MSLDERGSSDQTTSADGATLGGRVAVVTGAGRGLGRAHALALGAAGAAVLANDLGVDLDGRGSDPSPAAEVADEIRGAGGSAVADATDVASIAGGAAVVESALSAFGRIDVVVNNAGFAQGGGDPEHPLGDDLDALIGVHFKAAVGTTSAAIPHMRAQGFGRIVNTVSEVALDTRRMSGGFGYGAAKAALWSFTLAAAKWLEGTGVTVNAVSPGARTRMSAGLLDGEAGGSVQALDLRPEHVARLVAFLASERAGGINGRILHAAAGVVREYVTSRTADTELVRRLEGEILDRKVELKGDRWE